ncbi:MAG: TetR family transcriptional regulator [Chromatiales bacterium]|jgi:AcrR family transcriptional regulator
MSTKQHPRARGRPPTEGAGEARAALLDAARKLFVRREFRAVSVRDLAGVAGVNPALVHYHFGDKEGLYRAMVKASLGPLLAGLETVQRDGDLDLRGFLERYIRTLAANPWLPNLVVREVFYGDDGFRRDFVREFASRVGSILRTLIERAREAGEVRPDLDPGLAALGLISQSVFPFIAAPITEPAVQVRVDEVFVDRWIGHLMQMFFEGAGHA